MVLEIFIALTNGKQRLVIDGPLDLFQRFFITLIEHPDSPDPQPEPVIPPKGAIS
jgi:hypothetical protein